MGRIAQDFDRVDEGVEGRFFGRNGVHQQELAAGLEHPERFAQGACRVVVVVRAVAAGDDIERSIGVGKGAHVAKFEADVRDAALAGEFRGHFDHLGRDIDADDLGRPAGQGEGGVAGPGAQVEGAFPSGQPGRRNERVKIGPTGVDGTDGIGCGDGAELALCGFGDGCGSHGPA